MTYNSGGPRLHCDPARLRTERGRPLILGHRGMPGDALENRMEGFRAALEAGADGVEFDVQLAADGVPVVIHDASLERTTGRAGRVGDLGSGELEGLGVIALTAQSLLMRGSGVQRLEGEVEVGPDDFEPRNETVLEDDVEEVPGDAVLPPIVFIIVGVIILGGALSVFVYYTQVKKL